MIPSPGCPLWLPDLPGPAGASAMPAVSYTTPWGTILLAAILRRSKAAHVFFKHQIVQKRHAAKKRRRLSKIVYFHDLSALIST
jgi:hypothetical protein